MNLTDWTGFAGVSLLLLAFILQLRGIIQKESISYLALNTIGAGLACLASVMLNYLPFIVLEGCWTLVSAIGLARTLLKPQA
jgi:hypothetical protein